MDHLLSSVLLAISSNLDNFGVGIAYGTARRRIRLRHNLVIAVLSGGGTLLSMATGEWVNDFMSEEFANWLGAAMMIAIGVYGVVHSLRRANGRTSPITAGASTSTSEAAVLAVSLSFNNLGSGLGAGVSHVGIGLTSALTTAGSLAALTSGQFLGRRALAAIPRSQLGVAAGLIFIAVGIYELFV